MGLLSATPSHVCMKIAESIWSKQRSYIFTSSYSAINLYYLISRASAHSGTVRSLETAA